MRALLHARSFESIFCYNAALIGVVVEYERRSRDSSLRPGLLFAICRLENPR